MQITLCPIDMRRIVKGLYLVGKKYFFISKKKGDLKSGKNKDLDIPSIYKQVKTTAVQGFISLKKKKGRIKIDLDLLKMN